MSDAPEYWNPFHGAESIEVSAHEREAERLRAEVVRLTKERDHARGLACRYAEEVAWERSKIESNPFGDPVRDPAASVVGGWVGVVDGPRSQA